jgi:hypothetical protein
MNTIELIAIVGRVVAVGATLAAVGWFTGRRIARQAPGRAPIRQYLDRTAAARTESEPTS